MNNKLNLKSALVGLAVGIVVTLGIGAASSPVGPVGRYQVAGAGNAAVIIDTTTGQAWRAFLPGDRGNTDPGFTSVKNGDSK